MLLFVAFVLSLCGCKHVGERRDNVDILVERASYTKTFERLEASLSLAALPSKDESDRATVEVVRLHGSQQWATDTVDRSVAVSFSRHRPKGMSLPEALGISFACIAVGAPLFGYGVSLLKHNPTNPYAESPSELVPFVGLAPLVAGVALSTSKLYLYFRFPDDHLEHVGLQTRVGPSAPATETREPAGGTVVELRPELATAPDDVCWNSPVIRVKTDSDGRAQVDLPRGCLRAYSVVVQPN